MMELELEDVWEMWASVCVVYDLIVPSTLVRSCL